MKSQKKLIFMILLTLITQIFILIKSSIIASNFGASIEFDAFSLSNNIATLSFSFIGAGVTTVLIPNLSKDKENVNTFITLIYSVAIIILIFLILLSKDIIYFISGNNNLDFINLGATLLIINIITQFIISIQGTTNAIQFYNEQFNISKIGNLLSIVVVVLCMLIGDNNIYFYTLITLICAILNTSLQIVFVKKLNYTYKLSYSFKNYQFISMIKVYIPIVFSTGLYQLSLIIDNSISSRLGEGVISTLNYSNSIVSMINLLMIGNITTFLYPTIAKNIKNKNSQKDFFNYITHLNTLTFLIVIGFIIFGQHFIKILYERGNFSSSLTTTVYYCTVIYIISLPINSMRDLLYKYFYSNNDTSGPFKNSLITSILNIILSIFFSEYIGIFGVVLATTLSSYIGFITIFVRYKKEFSFNFNFKKILFENIKIIISSCLTLFTGYVLNIHNNDSILAILLGSILVSIIYVLFLTLFRSKTINLFYNNFNWRMIYARQSKKKNKTYKM